MDHGGTYTSPWSLGGGVDGRARLSPPALRLAALQWRRPSSLDIRADQSTSSPSSLVVVVVESSIRKFAREDVGAGASFVRSADVLSRRPTDGPAARPSPGPYTSQRAPTGSHQHRAGRRQVNLVAETINHPINATSHSPPSPIHCVGAGDVQYKDAMLCNSPRLQSSSHVAGQLCRSRPLLLQQLTTDSILHTHPRLITSSDTVSGCRVCTVSHAPADNCS